jgi:hypothetical protein
MRNSIIIRNRRLFWGGHVAAWRESGLTQAAYSRLHKIAATSLSYWSHRESHRIPLSSGNETLSEKIYGEIENSGVSTEVKFVPVPGELLKRSGKAGISQGHLTLHVGSRFRVEIPSDFSPDALSQVVQVLESLR